MPELSPGHLAYWAYPAAFGLKQNEEKSLPLDDMWAEAAKGKLEKLEYQSTTHCAEGNEVLSAWNSEELQIAFRGTTDGFDWLINGLVYGPSGMPSAGAHAHKGHFGYVKSLEAVWSHVVELLEAHKGKRLGWRGHSKGGAMASLACSRAWAEGYKAASCYTFGEAVNSSPGLASLADNFEFLDRRRYVKCQDVVPRVLLLMRMTRRLKHWGDNWYFDRFGQLRKNPSWFWMEWDRIASFRHTGIKSLVDHHSMEDYHIITRNTKS